ncbi:MAG: VWA domain-containing protein, partial [Verrucomicrobiales bacterium]|nr:VWA domain-containing protein [Verrucomicrobiales bacterium]
MNFLNLQLLAALAPLVALPFFIHLFNRHFPHSIKFPNIERIKKSLSERSKLARWRHLLMTLLRTLVVLLALFAFLQPVLPKFGSKPGDAANGRQVLIVLDRSLSMEFTPGSGTSAARSALVEIGKVLETLGGDDRVNAILAGAEATPLLPDFTPGHDQIRAMLTALPPSYARTDVTKAVALAESMIDGKSEEGAEIYFFSDFQRSNWGVASFDGFPETARLFFVDATDGRDRPNTALVSVEPSATRVAAGDVVTLDITAANWSPDPVTLPIEAIVSGAGSVGGEIALGPESTGRLLLEFTAPEEGLHAVEIRTPDDGLPADNRQFLSLEVRAREDVLIVSDADPEQGGAVFVEAALNPYDGGSGIFAPRILPSGAVTPAMLASTQKVVLTGVTQLSPEFVERIVAFLETGGGLVYFVDGDHDQENLVALDKASSRGVAPFHVAGKLTTENFGGDPQKIAKGNF